MAPRLDLISADLLMARRFPPPRFVVPGLIPEGLTLLAGRPKLGKSWISMNISLALAAGLVVLGREPGEAGDVLHLALEDGPRRLQERLRLMLGGASAPARLAFATTCPTLDDGGADAIRAWAASVSTPRLVVIDVFQRIRGKGQDGRRLYADDYAAVLPLKALADDLGLAVIVVTHCRKSDANDDPLDAVSATTGLTAAADHILILDRDRDGTTLYGRGRDVEEFDLALRFDPRRGLWTALGDKGEVNRSDSRNAILAALKAAGEAMSPKAMADASGVGHAVVKHLVGRLVEAGDLIRVGAGSYTIPNAVHSVRSVHPSHPSSSDEGKKGGGKTVKAVNKVKASEEAA